MIADERLRELFKLESEEYLQCLDDGLLRLEKDLDDKASVEEVFRAVHSLKGAAHMLGLSALSSLAHRLEDGLNSVRHDQRLLSLDFLQAMSLQLADIRSWIGRAFAPREAGVAVAPEHPATSSSPLYVSAPTAAATASDDLLPTGSSEPNSNLPSGLSAPFRLESVRIESSRLDTLLTQAGELTVTRMRVARRLSQIDALIDYCEDWGRKALTQSNNGAEPASAITDQLTPLGEQLARLRAEAGEDSARLDTISNALESGIREIRLLPLSNVFRVFSRMVHDLAAAQGKPVKLVIEGDETSADKRILEEMKDPLMHLLRNAVDHGIESPQEREHAGKAPAGSIHLRARRTESCIEIEVSDDGRGLDEDAILQAALKRGLESAATLAALTRAQIWSLIFTPGLSTAHLLTDVSGRGVGLDVVRTNVERLKGSLQIGSSPGKGMSITLRLPVTLVTARVLIVEVNGCPYGLPVEHVLTSRMLKPEDVFALEGRDATMLECKPVALARLGELLELPAPVTASGRNPPAASPCVMLRSEAGPFAVLVDALLDEQEVVLKPQSALLERIRNVSGATILDSGAVCMVLNTQDLHASLRQHAMPVGPREPFQAAKSKKCILLAEDSITTRTQEARILADAGYEVITAVDGLDAFNKLPLHAFDAVVTDVNMPNMDGLELAERIRRDAKYADLPIVLVTSLASNEDRQRGLEAGANAYITKPAFDQQDLLDCLDRLI